jgi:hypothetical protein
MQIRSTSLRRRVALGLSIGLTALAIAVSPAAAPQAVSAQSSAAQNDPAWDYGRGGAEVPGQPACYLPAGSETMRKMYSLMRPACFPGKLQ